MKSLLNDGAVAVYRRLFSYVLPHSKVIAWSIVAMVLYSAANAWVPFIIRDVIEVLSDPDRTSGGMVPVVLLVAAALRSTTDFASVYGLGWLGRRVIRDLRNEVFRQYTELPARFFDRESTLR